MTFKFENLDVWQLSLDYVDQMYELAEKLPDSERFNLKSQLTRAATSVALNIAEGSTGQSDAEQSRFLGMAIRSLLETVACQRIISRRNYIRDQANLNQADLKAQELAKRLHAFRKSLAGKTIREESAPYETNEL
ncbi:MAG TPA: four helix bundle protein [Anaerolineales bacterium]|nr:four helix bundle protein [Anaerolineales bacterium]